MPKNKGNLALIYKNGFPLILESGCPVINWVFGKFGNENEILLAGIAPHAMVLGNLSSLRPAFVLALTVRFHLVKTRLNLNPLFMNFFFRNKLANLATKTEFLVTKVKVIFALVDRMGRNFESCEAWIFSDFFRNSITHSFQGVCLSCFIEVLNKPLA